MKEFFLAYGILSKTGNSIMIMHLTSKAMVHSPIAEQTFFDIIVCVLQGDTLACYLFIICLDYVLRKALDSNNHLCLTLSKSRSRRYPTIKITDVDSPYDVAAISDYLTNATILFHKVEYDASEIINAKKQKFSVITNNNLELSNDPSMVTSNL